MIFLDSDVLIDYGRGEPRVVQLLDDMEARGEEFAVTSINAAELHRGAQAGHNPPRKQRRLRTILERLTEVPFGPRAARRYGRLMAALDQAGQSIPTMDGLIAAVVLENGGRLATGNNKDFDRIAGLDLVRPDA